MGINGSRLPKLAGLVLVAVFAIACSRAQSGDTAARSDFLFNELFGAKISTDESLFSEARELWEKLAEEGDAKAQYYLSFLYWSGLGGVQRDEATAVRLTQNSAHAGYARAQGALANWYEHGGNVKKDESLAVEWWLRAAANGDWIAQSRLERAYTLGEIGLPVDPQEAARWRESPKNRAE